MLRIRHICLEGLIFKPLHIGGWHCLHLLKCIFNVFRIHLPRYEGVCCPATGVFQAHRLSIIFQPLQVSSFSRGYFGFQHTIKINAKGSWKLYYSHRENIFRLIVQVTIDIFLFFVQPILLPDSWHSCCVLGEGVQERMIRLCTSTSAILLRSPTVQKWDIKKSLQVIGAILNTVRSGVSHPKKVIRISRNAAHFPGWYIQHMLPPHRSICCSFTCRWLFTVEIQGVCIAAPVLERLYKEQLSFVVQEGRRCCFLMSKRYNCWCCANLPYSDNLQKLSSNIANTYRYYRLSRQGWYRWPFHPD